MRYLLAALLVLALAAPASASLQLVLTGTPSDYILEAVIPPPGPFPAGNQFKTELEAFGGLGLKQIVKGDVRALVAGTLTFYAHGSESGFRNAFSMGTAFVEEPLSGDITPWLPNPVAFGTISIAALQLFSDLDAIFTTDHDGNGGDDAPIGNQGFGIFAAVDGSGNTILDYATTLFFGYDDNGANKDDNHDDLIIRVVFTPDLTGTPPGAIPEPISGVVWGLLATAAMVVPGVARRR